MRLADACTIHTGYTARGRLEPAAAGGVLAIQLRDISPEGLVHPERLTRVQLEALPTATSSALATWCSARGVSETRRPPWTNVCRSLPLQCCPCWCCARSVMS